MHGFSAQSVYVCGNPSQKSPPYIGGGLLHYWGACNASCGGGIRVKQRTCFNQDVGDDALLVCIGDDTENDTCNTNECPSKNIHTNDNNNS
jgi:hypothetical protein